MSRTWWGLLTVAAIVTAGDLAVTAYVYSWFVRVSPNDNPGDVGIAIALGAVLASAGARGPLETVVGRCADAAAGSAREAPPSAPIGTDTRG